MSSSANTKDLFDISQISCDDNGDFLFSKTLEPFVAALPPMEKLRYRKELTDLIMKYGDTTSFDKSRKRGNSNGK